ncbi:CCDC130 isoform 9, partial [Pongo abelii]
NRYHNSHPLRERARKLSQGILIIRFEMPYNIWCDGCKNHIGMGVRYNAEKKKVGNYYTTPIYRFRMKCHLCVNYIEMQTDPANCDYVIVSGAQRKEERWDMADNEQVLTTEAGDGRHVPAGARRGRPQHTQEGAAHPEPHPGGPERLEGRLRPQQHAAEKVPGEGGSSPGSERMHGGPRPGSSPHPTTS